MSALAIRGLHAGYGSAEVLFGVDLAIGAAEVLAVLGRNGMGKSTLIRAILGLTAVSAGKVEVAEKDVTGWPSHRVARAGVGWVPYFIDRMHEHFEKRGDWIPNGWKRDPREYLESGNIWVSCEPEEPILPGVIDVLGDGFILYASDYPHWDGDWPESTKHLRSRSDISEQSRARVGGENAARFYAL